MKTRIFKVKVGNEELLGISDHKVPSILVLGDKIYPYQSIPRKDILDTWEVESNLAGVVLGYVSTVSSNSIAMCDKKDTYWITYNITLGNYIEELGKVRDLCSSHTYGREGITEVLYGELESELKKFRDDMLSGKIVFDPDKKNSGLCIVDDPGKEKLTRPNLLYLNDCRFVYRPELEKLRGMTENVYVHAGNIIFEFSKTYSPNLKSLQDTFEDIEDSIDSRIQVFSGRLGLTIGTGSNPYT